MPTATPKTMRDSPLIIRLKPRTAPALRFAWYGMSRNHCGFSVRFRFVSVPPTKNRSPVRNIRHAWISFCLDCWAFSCRYCLWSSSSFTWVIFLCLCVEV